MNGGKILFLSFLMSLATGITVYWLVGRQQKKIAVVDAVKLFDKYDMKRELEGRAKMRLQTISKQSDSIGNKLQMARATRNEEDIKTLTYAYNYIKESLESEYKQSNQDINEAVWKRLNPAIDEYGKKKGLHLIIGANGMGSVLYNDDYYDLTEDVTKFVNKKYAEGN